jgi:hypothetical protein
LTGLDPTHAALVDAVAGATFQQYARALLQIEDENGELTNFELNEAQEIVYAVIKRKQSAMEPVKLLILKGRQQGMSTLCQMLIAHRMFTQPGVRCLTVGHNLGAVHDLYGKFDRAMRMLPDFLRPDSEPGGERGRRMKLADPIRSSYRADSAHDPEGVGRGMTIQVAHLTEIPQWSKPDETMQAVLATIPDTPQTMILVETTAKGASGWFYEQWMLAQKKLANGEEPEFYPVFVPWFKTKRYARKRREGEPPLTKGERKFRDKYELTNEQVYWYRDQRDRFGERVTEEFPSNWMEAFLSSGIPYFKRDILKWLREDRRRTDFTAGFFHVYPGTGKAAFRKEDFAPLRVFETPNHEHRYAIGIDFASGRAKDSSAIVVIDIDAKRVVATYQSNSELPDAVLEQAVCLGRWYYTGTKEERNYALLIPERNGIGQPLVDRLVNDIGYPNVYRDRDGAAVRGKRSSRFGWATTVATRRWLLEEMAMLIHSKGLDIPCDRIIDEMHTFVFTDEEGQHAAAQPGRHDDLVMALAMATRGYLSSPTPEPERAGHRPDGPTISSMTGY